jgi:chromosome partitioning protein
MPNRNREQADMQVWAIANQKGGVGKTTTTLFLGRGLAQAGHRVLLVDLDPHASLTRAFAVPANPPPSGTHDLFGTSGASLASLARSTDIEGLRLVAAQPALATLERRGATQPGLGLALGRALHGVHASFDYVLLDCPPTLGLLMINALAAADRLVVPTQTDQLALHGLADMLRTAEMVERSRRRTLPSFVLPTLYDRRTRSGIHNLDLLHDRYEGRVWPAAVPVDTRLRDANALTAAVPPSGRGADAYRRALTWLLAQSDASQRQAA